MDSGAFKVMCGVAAIYAYHYAAPPVNRSELCGIRDAMALRGPDGSGEWFSGDERVGLGHRRLAILDPTDLGAQPMQNESGSLRIIFNGEIYNFREIRAALEAKGRRFRTKTDTEVILRLYEDKGEGMLSDLRGMFAIVIWDSRKRRLFLARDPYGIKPLYYADDGWSFRAGSQVKALLKGGGVSRDLELAGQVGFLLTGSVPEPFTFYKEIRQLPAGSMMTVDECGPSIPRRYFSLSTALQSVGAAADEKGFLGRCLRDSVRHHLVSDVPVGVFLSAGIDSAVLAALAAEESQPPRSLTLSFEEFRETADDEAPLARETASWYGLPHAESVLTRADFTAGMEDFFSAMDQPTIDGANVYFVSRAAHQLGWKVALSGLGADELFAGYPSFQYVPIMARAGALRPASWLFHKAAPAWNLLGRPKASGLAAFSGSYERSYFLARGLFMPWELGEFLGRDNAIEGMRRLDLFRKMKEELRPSPARASAKVAVLEAAFYMRNQLLRDADWAGMAHSLEIRTPFVDAELFRRLAPALASSRPPTKASLAATPSRPLPATVMQRKKTGFLVPISKWLESEAEPCREWRAVPSLRRAHWSRRWAYTVFKKAAA